jgi:uncharacterized phage-like protein YoqJ
MVIAGTGHRPPKLGGYGRDVQLRLRQLAVDALHRLQPETVISGMALGWDQALANAALDLGIPLVAYIPFEGQELAWPNQSQKVYRALLDEAYHVEVVSSGGYSARKMQQRNIAMVNTCDLLLALWNGSPGGTKNCIFYARRIGKKIENLWYDWVHFDERNR